MKSASDVLTVNCCFVWWWVEIDRTRQGVPNEDVVELCHGNVESFVMSHEDDQVR